MPEEAGGVTACSSEKKGNRVSVHYSFETGSEKKLEQGLLRFINFMFIAHPNEINLTEKIQKGMEDYKTIRDNVLLQQDISPNSKLWDIRDYAKHVLANGDPKKKRNLFDLFDYQFYLQNRMITTLRAH